MLTLSGSLFSADMISLLPQLLLSDLGLGSLQTGIAQWYSAELVIERSRVRVPEKAVGRFSSPGSTFCADTYFDIRSTPVLLQ